VIPYGKRRLVLVALRYVTSTSNFLTVLMPSTHRRRDATVELSRVGVGGVYWALYEIVLLHVTT